MAAKSANLSTPEKNRIVEEIRAYDGYYDDPKVYRTLRRCRTTLTTKRDPNKKYSYSTLRAKICTKRAAHGRTAQPRIPGRTVFKHGVVTPASYIRRPREAKLTSGFLRQRGGGDGGNDADNGGNDADNDGGNDADMSVSYGKLVPYNEGLRILEQYYPAMTDVASLVKPSDLTLIDGIVHMRL